MNKIINKNNILNTLLVLFTSVFFISLFVINNVKAKDEDFKITSATISSKSATVIGGISSSDSSSIDSDITFHKLNDYVVFDFEIKNNTNKKITIDSIIDNNSSNYLVYQYDEHKNYVVDKNDTFTLSVKVVYQNLVNDVNNRSQLNNVSFSINYNGDESTTFSIVNPNTYDNISINIIIAIISLIGIMICLILKHKRAHYILLLIMMFPLLVKANLVLSQLNLKLKVNFNDRLVVNYSLDNQDYQAIVGYNENLNINIPNIAGKAAKLVKEDGTDFNSNDPITADLKLNVQYFYIDYDLEFDLAGGTGTYPSTYTAENDVIIANPTRVGYAFAGWTGTDLQDEKINLVIPAGSIGKREYTANWTPNNYTITYYSSITSSSYTQQMTYDKAEKLIPNRFFKNGNYIFKGWTNIVDGTEVVYTNTELVSNLVTEGNITLYPVWEDVTDFSILKDGRWLNAQMKQLAGSPSATFDTEDTNIVAILRTNDELPNDYIDVSSVGHNPIYMWYDSTTQTIYFKSDAKYIYLNSDSKNLFSNMQNLNTIDFDTILTNKASNMFGMFAKTGSLEYVSFDNFDTTRVTDMSSMFNQSSVSNLDLSKFATSNVTNMNRMFANNPNLVSLDISSFDTSNVKDMTKMFDLDTGLTSLNVSNFNTAKVTNMEAMFRYLSNIQLLDLSNFNTENVTNMAEMFSGMTNLTTLTLSSNFKTSNVLSMKQMFNQCSSLTSLDLSSFNTQKVADMSGMFNHCTSLTKLDLSNFNTAKVTNMSSMFHTCSSLTSLDISSFNTENVNNMNRMFSSLSSLQTLDISSFNTSNVKDMTKMFDNMSSLVTIYASDNFITASVTLGSDMFKNDIALVGGFSTHCDGSHNINYIYARIDGGETSPGYFTRKM